jgi:tetrahydromethanopterin S-methyltransferase subunit C
VTTNTRRPLRRCAALSLGLLAAIAVAGVVVMTLPLWAAAAIGLVVGEGIAVGLEAWDDRWFPERILILAAGIK